jgi:hypothetical protein
VNAVLQAILGLKTGPFRAGIQDAKGQALGLQKTLSSVGQTIGIAFSAAGAMMAARSIATWASGISEAAQNVGILSSEMLALNGIAEQNGLKVDDLAKMLAKLQTQQMDAAKGSKTARDAFAGLGLELDAVMRLDPVELMRAVAKAAMETGTPVSALADIFGDRLGPRAVAALRQISEDGLGPLNADLGEAVDQVERLDDRMTALASTIKGNLATSLNWLIDAFGTASDFWGGMMAGGGMTPGGVVGGAEGIRRAEYAKRQQREADAARRTEEKKEKADALIAELRKTEADASAKAASKTGGKKSVEQEIADAQWDRDEKWAADRRRQMDRERDIRKSYGEDIDQVRQRMAGVDPAGRGVTVSGIETMGAGGFGVDRSGLGMADRQFRMQQEQNGYLAEIARLQSQLLDAIQDNNGGSN